MTTTHNVFYSWQSDLPSRTNRGFIADALERAAAALRANEAVTIEPVVDRDTAGVPGSPAISETILHKITHAEIFVPDVSLVTVTNAGRPSPNPNVLFELGYAVSELGWDRIVMVMNTAFGDVTQLPFDLRGRRILPYNLPDVPGEPRADLRRELERRLKEAVLTILGDRGARARDDDNSRRSSLIQWATNLRNDRVRRIANREGVAGRLSSTHTVAVHGVPYGAISDDIRSDIAAMDQRMTFAAPIGATEYNTRFNADGLLRENMNGDSLDGYLQLFRNGFVESVDSGMMVGHGREDGLPAPLFAMSLGRFVQETVRMWLALRVVPPACFLVMLSGLKGLPMILPAHPGYVTRSFPEDSMSLPDVLITDFAADPRPALRHSLDVLWQSAGEDRCDYFDSSGNWIGRF